WHATCSARTPARPVENSHRTGRAAGPDPAPRTGTECHRDGTPSSGPAGRRPGRRRAEELRPARPPAGTGRAARSRTHLGGGGRRRDGAPPRPRSRAWGSRQPTTTPRTSVPDPTSPARSAGQASVLVPQLQVAFGAAASGHLEHRGDRRVAGGDDGVLAGG